MQRLVGFDLDLTLIDSRPTILGAFAELAEAWELPIDLAAVESRLGLKLEDELAFWLPPARRSEAAADFRHRYLRLLGATTRPLPGAASALEAVRLAGDASLVVTAKHESTALPSLRAAGLSPDHLHSHLHGAEKGELLRRLGADCYLGDTPADMEAAAVAGILGVGVTTGVYDANALRAAGAGVLLDSLEAFPAWYARW